MPVNFSDEIRQALNGGTPVELVDPQTQQAFVVLTKERCEVMRAPPADAPEYDDGEFDIAEAYPLMDEAARTAGWDHPDEDIYNDLDPREAYPSVQKTMQEDDKVDPTLQAYQVS